MKMNNNSNHRARRGFTLIELVVVLVVLVALAGMALQFLPNMITRSHAATGAASAKEAAKAIQLYEAMNFVHPNGWDSLVSSAGDGQTFRTDRFQVIALNGTDPGPFGIEPARIRSALTSAGITFSYTMADGIQGNGRLDDNHANRQGSTARLNTFDPYDGVAEEDFLAGGRVVVLGPGMQEIGRFGFPNPESDPTTAGYVAFGIGERLTAVGKTLASAPVHFPEAGDLPPTLNYSRFAAIYRIPASGPAELATVTGIHGDHFDSIDSHLEEYYETAQAPRIIPQEDP